jgi:class 3 adenylate cyclase
VELPGDDHVLWYQHPEQTLAAIYEFLTGTRFEPEAERILATVLFTDIVDSTRTAAELGDARWREVLDRHQGTVGKALERFGGRQIKSTGDGFLATFDGPARAVRCARTILDSSEQEGVKVRAGVHTGECEVMGDDIGGIAVHIAARVSALAGSGEVLVSRTVKDLVAGSGLGFDERGTHELKGERARREPLARTARPRRSPPARWCRRRSQGRQSARTSPDRRRSPPAPSTPG